MADVESTACFLSLADGTTLVRANDGTFRPAPSDTNTARLAAMPEAEIERYAASDPDHPALDEAFWAGVDAAGTVRLDADVVAHFRAGGDGYEARINAVLRRAIRERTS